MNRKRIVIEEVGEGHLSISVSGFGDPDRKELEASRAVRWGIRALYAELEAHGYCAGCEHLIVNPVFCRLKDGRGPFTHDEDTKYVGRCYKAEAAGFKNLTQLPALIAMAVLGPDDIERFIAYLEAEAVNPEFSEAKRAAARAFIADIRGLMDEVKDAPEKAPDWTSPKPIDSNSVPDQMKALFGKVIEEHRNARVDEEMRKLQEGEESEGDGDGE